MPEIFRVLIADDEALGRLAVRRLVEADDRFLIVAEAANGHEALEVLEKQGIDVAFLDISMPGLTGLELAEKIGGESVVIVFVTAHGQHALEAFDHAATDFVVKPIHEVRFQQCLQRVADRLAPRASTERPRVTLRQGGTTVLLSPDRFLYAEADGNYVVLTLEKPVESHRLRMTLTALLESIEDESIMRVHRAYAVGLLHVTATRSTDGAHGLEAVMGNEARIPIGRTFRSEFEAKLRGR